MDRRKEKLSSTLSSAEASKLPPSLRVRLYELFMQIEREFELVYTDNLFLQEKIEESIRSRNISNLNEPSSLDTSLYSSGRFDSLGSIIGAQQQTKKKMTAVVIPPPTQPIYAHKLRSHTSKLKAQTNRIMSNLKGPLLKCTAVKRYTGHRDGIWEVSSSKMRLPIIGTASADHTAIIWGMHSAKQLLVYTGHSGSVNSLRFHPFKELVITASGDGTVHIWQYAVQLTNESSSGRVGSSDEELEQSAEKEFPWGNSEADVNDTISSSVLNTPLRSLKGHKGVVISADWFADGDQAITAGWDRYACIWDTNTGQLVQQLSGHDEELTHTTAHSTSPLILTASKDSTFRLWDFRESIHSVSVFQGHTDAVNCVVFTSQGDQIVSAGDDRTVKVWDLRNMRTPVTTIHCESAINRMSINGNLIALPLDNRNVRLYDLSNGQRMARLPPRSSRQGHSRMVCSAVWSEDTIGKPNLFTSGFDRIVLGWDVQQRGTDKDLDPELKFSLGSKVKEDMMSKGYNVVSKE